MFLNKSEQREKIKAKLKLETKEAIDTASRVICSSLIKVLENLPSKISNVLAWTPFFVGEVDLTDFVNFSITKHSVYLPKVDTAESPSTMRFLRLDANWQNKLQNESGKYKEPEIGEEFIPTQSSITLVILPALAFDKSGNRLGRGKGHYDKFLNSVKDCNFIKVGVCLDWQVLDEIPVEQHDIPVNIICTEKQILGAPTLSNTT